MGETLSRNDIYSWSYQLVLDLVGNDLEWVAYLAATLAVVMLVVNGVLLLGTGYTWFERRLLGRFQNRLGPNRAGPFGVLQPIADAIKLLFKEDIVPRAADRTIFTIAPVVMIAPTLLVLAVIPFGPGSWVADLNIGLLYISAVSGIAAIAVLMAGYASANKFATFGSMRAAAMLVSYEVPLVMSLLGVTILAGSMSLIDVVMAQTIPYVIVTPLGVLIFLTAISAELNRNPFDLNEAESEIVAGYMTEYSGMKYGIFMLAEFTNTVVAGAIFVVLFLQGWHWSFLPGHLWFFIKVGGFIFVATWVRATLPRFRLDQILTLAWKGLFPLSLVNVLALALEVNIWGQDGLSSHELWIMAGINWTIAIIAIVVIGRFVSLRTTPAAARIGLG